MGINTSLASLLLGLFIIEVIPGCFGYAGQQRLYDDLLRKRKYLTSVLPHWNISEPVIMYMNLSLTQILDVDEKNQIVSFNVWVMQEWKDPNFIWNPDQYDGVHQLQLPSAEVWTPDLILYNNAGGNWDLGSSSNTKVKIKHDGSLVWKPPIVYQSACDINVEFFPFDIQRCRLKMGTWTHNGLLIDLRHTAQKHGDMSAGRVTFDNCESSIDYAIDISEYVENVEFDLMEVSARRNIEKYPCCPEPYLDVTFQIKIRRRTLFYGTNLICPCMAISFLAIFVFYLPADSQEKITLSISILLSLTVFILVVFDLTPPTSLVVPLVVKYLMFTLILVTLSIMASTVVLNVRYRSPDVNKIPDWVRQLFLNTLPPLLWMKRPSEDDGEEADKASDDDSDSFASLDAQINKDNEEAFLLRHLGFQGQKTTRGRNEQEQVEMDIKKALVGVRRIVGLLKKESKLGDVEEDWKFVAIILDRLFLWMFSLANIVGVLGIFLQAPTLTDTSEALTAHQAANLMKTINVTRICAR